ncbi:hypothetical protein H2200_010020 [Cladophialophora chaetospira]|uniref:Bud22 domain-containing protein n=1 Tax=Cladophialophora chaetospira TaxID=386627 RepID=A0AA39CEI4_9EURO|nr:hypothetical protein H2200_010020 [Cladophialophora chaetospira]
MSKRKREDDFDAPEIEDQALRLKVSRLKAKTHQGVKILHNALKLARGFERQKLGRRQKNASSNPQVLLRLREEVIVLKQLQLEQTARSKLFKILARTKRIKEHPAFIAAYGSQPVAEHTEPGAVVTVVGRLFNSNPVKQALSEIWKPIYGVLGIPQILPTESRGSGPSASGTTKDIASAKPDSDFDGFSGDDSAVGHASAREEELSVSELEDDELFEHARDRLASSEEESDDEDIEVEPLLPQKDDIRTKNNKRALAREQVSPSPSASSESGNGRRPTTQQQPRQDIGRNAFLPSLSMGGYYSGSESEDDINQYHGPALPKERKNRRGQRARQQLAELKFGQRANHLGAKKFREERSSGWDAKRGAVGPSGQSKHHVRQGKVDPKFSKDRQSARADRASKSNMPKVRDDQGPIHPSWEAAKKRKMQDQTKASFHGKKITFD